MRTVLSMIRHGIENKGSPSDVVLIYWLGRGAEKSDRVMAAVMGMKKLDLQAMRDA